MRQQTEQEFVARQQSLTQLQQQSAVLEIAAPVRPTAFTRNQTTNQAKVSAREILPEIPRQIQEPVSTPIAPPVVKMAKTAPQAKPLVMDKRTTILDMAEQGWSVTDIAQKMGIGKGEVMLLLKLRKKSVE